MSQQPAGKMSAAPLAAEALEPAAGMLEGRQRKLESMIRDPRSPVNVESLLVRRAAGPRCTAPRGKALGGVTKGALPSPRAGGRKRGGRKEGRKERAPASWRSFPGGGRRLLLRGCGGAAPLHALGRAAGEGRWAADGRPRRLGVGLGAVGGHTLHQEPALSI